MMSFANSAAPRLRDSSNSRPVTCVLPAVILSADNCLEHTPMYILVDREIREEIAQGLLIIEPYEDRLIQPNSYDVRLSDRFSWHEKSDQVIDPYASHTVLEGVVQSVQESVVLAPYQFILGATLEAICLPDYIVGQLTGKSS